LQPSKVDCLYGGAAAKGCAVRLATHRAMTIQGVEQPPIDLVLDAAAQAASAHHACTTLPTGAGCAANGVRGGEPTAATSISQPSSNVPAWKLAAICHRQRHRRQAANCPAGHFAPAGRCLQRVVGDFVGECLRVGLLSHQFVHFTALTFRLSVSTIACPMWASRPRGRRLPAVSRRYPRGTSRRTTRRESSVAFHGGAPTGLRTKGQEALREPRGGCAPGLTQSLCNDPFTIGRGAPNFATI